jgi:hypothetical protein
MSRTALYFASGESLYFGATLFLLAAVAPTFLKGAWMLRICNVVVWVALILMVMACPPFPIEVDLIFVAVFVLWSITSNQASPSPTSVRLRRGSTIALIVLLLVLTAIEFSHRRMPKIIGSASDHVVVIGDSISSGIDPHLQTWPLVLQQICGVEIRNLARPGAQVSEGLLRGEALSCPCVAFPSR